MTYRPLGYFLWGLLWLIFLAAVEVFPLAIIFLTLNGQISLAGDSGVLAWLLGVPVCAWVFFIFPFTMLSQALLGFVASALATRPQYRGVTVVEFVGSGRRTSMEPRVDSPLMRLISAIGTLGLRPGWVFALSAMAFTAGLGLVLTVAGPVAATAGAALVIIGAGGSVIGIRDRVNVVVKKRIVMPWDKHGLTEKYYKGLRYRENKRARDLQRAREAGRAGDIYGWGTAEATYALHEDGRAAYNARKGVPGALDGAIHAVFTAMDGAVTRERAEQFVIDAAAFRGKKPVPVRVDQKAVGQ